MVLRSQEQIKKKGNLLDQYADIDYDVLESQILAN